MSEQVRVISVTIEIATNKRTERKLLVLNGAETDGDETIDDFVSRVDCALTNMTNKLGTR